jgi:hypothetical protein
MVVLDNAPLFQIEQPPSLVSLPLKSNDLLFKRVYSELKRLNSYESDEDDQNLMVKIYKQLKLLNTNRKEQQFTSLDK